MAKELDAILDRGEACVAESCKLENGSVAFLEQIIHPIYETIVKVSYFFQSFNVSVQCLWSSQINNIYLYQS